MSDVREIAVIGLGSMGWGAALSLLRADFTVHGVDIRAEVLERFQAEGGKAFSTPAEAIKDVAIAFVFVINAAQTEEVLFGTDGAVSAACPGTLFILCPTMPPSAAIEIAGRLADAGMRVLDAPVSGGAARALSGEITVMAAGPEEAFELAGPALEAVSSKVFKLGENPGQGSKVKMINQLLAGVHIAATAEALTLAASEGLDLKEVYDVIRVSAGNSWMFENRGGNIVEGDYSPKSAVDIFVKDLGIVTSEAGAAGASVPLSETALALFKEASGAGLGKIDDAGVAMILARRAGILLPGMEDEQQ